MISEMLKYRGNADSCAPGQLDRPEVMTYNIGKLGIPLMTADGPNRDSTAEVESLLHDISRFRDLEMVLSRLLLHARTSTGAEAGSIFLFDSGRLRFRVMQNDAFKRRDVRLEQYRLQAGSIDASDSSLCGYVATTGQSIRIDDAYELPGDAPYQFDPSFDQKWSYRTRSVMAVPMSLPDGTVLGVLQLINARNDDKEEVPFSDADVLLADLFAEQATMLIERAQMTRGLIMRMIAMAELRDPTETGPHVNRVGECAVEIYRAWARSSDVDHSEARTFRDTLRLAAMLHDVGKVAIPDSILKKPAKLTADEFAVMKTHTVHGARLFRDKFSDIDRMASDIALSHHEWWDGNGYPGNIDDIDTDPIVQGPGRAREEIPLAARIVALADVYDALLSARSYKDPWPEEKVHETIREASGQQFDPALVDALFDGLDMIQAAAAKYNA